MRKVYYYECQGCGTVYEQEQDFGAPAYTEEFCQRCGGSRKVRRLICKTSFILKGADWSKNSYGLREAT
jgi:predicted nucleic acid-binding Zn ribbon protein